MKTISCSPTSDADPGSGAAVIVRMVTKTSPLGSCNGGDSPCILSRIQGRVRMKGTLTINSLGLALLLGFRISISPACAETIYVSTFNLNTIYEINSSGNVSVFATGASGLNDPEGLALDSSGNLYVANYGNSTIEEFNSSGTGSVFATASSGLSNPISLAFDSSGNLYVANQGNYTVEEFGEGGTGTVFATASSGLNNPYGIAFFAGQSLRGEPWQQQHRGNRHKRARVSLHIDEPSFIPYWSGVR